jgi:hypothetical protein
VAEKLTMNWQLASNPENWVVKRKVSKAEREMSHYLSMWEVYSYSIKAINNVNGMKICNINNVINVEMSIEMTQYNNEWK